MLTKEIELSAGTIDYLDTGGDGSVIVLVHGLMMDSTLWDAVVGQLSVDHRCVVPILPMGAHRRPMPEAADLSIPGIAKMVIELMIRLDLTDVTLVGNDTGGAIVQQVICTAPERIGRIVLASPGRRSCSPANSPRPCSGCSCSSCGCGRSGDCRWPSVG